MKRALFIDRDGTILVEPADEQIDSFLEAIKCFPQIEFIVTKSNADHGGARINELLDKADKEIENLHVFTSLGVRRYLSLMKHAELVLGNSSSGIIETPAFRVPTLNIGNRQRGRLQSKNIINVVQGKNLGRIIDVEIDVDGRIILSEMTFTPGGALIPFDSYDADLSYITVKIEVYDLYKASNDALIYLENNPQEFYDDNGEYDVNKYIDYTYLFFLLFQIQ